MRDSLPRSGPWQNECMVLNQASIHSPQGTHWSCFAKAGRNVFYFDSFGKLPPPLELIKYLGSDCYISYNSVQYQSFNTINCGHLCLKFLCEFYHLQ